MRPLRVFLSLLAVLVAACGGSQAVSQSTAAPATAPTTTQPTSTTAGGLKGTPLSRSDIDAAFALFDSQPLTGGQTPPRISKWVNNSTFVFLQFDKSKKEEATTLRYVGMGVKGVFCSEAQPDPTGKSFTHFHRLSAPDYASGHGGPPGEPGYWMTWLAVDQFEAQNRKVAPGIDYQFSPTPAPSCGGEVPKADFAAPGAGNLSKDDITKLAAFFSDKPLTGGQTPPRVSKWVNDHLFAFLQFDKAKPEEATSLRYIGIGERSEFCGSSRRSPDFTHFHRVSAPDYASGHGGQPHDQGYWMTWVSAAEFEAQGRTVTPGVDRAFSPTPPPAC